MIGLYMANKTEEAFSAAETAKRREFALKRMLTTPHKPHKPIGKKKKQKTEKNELYSDSSSNTLGTKPLVH
jgi:hypothetical protein